MTKNTFLPYARQSISQKDVEEAVKTLKEPVVTRGPKVEEFERAVADYCGAKFAVAFNSGTSALHAAAYAAQVGAFDRLFTTPNTFIGSITGLLKLGASPVFIDIQRETGNMDLDILEANLNRKASRGRDVVLAVHFAGKPLDMMRIDRMIEKPDTLIIEDAAHAFGSCYSTGEKVGSCACSQLTAFSFHPNKTITTLEGGMVTTNQEHLYRQLLLFRNNGIERTPETDPWYYEVLDATGNFHFTELQAALGLSQIKRVDEFIAKRKKISNKYRSLLQSSQYIIPLIDSKPENTANHLFAAAVDFEAAGIVRKEVMEKLSDIGIGTQVHYIPLYRHPYFARKSQEVNEYFPAMEAYYARALSLPLHCEMDENDANRVVEELNKILN